MVIWYIKFALVIQCIDLPIYMLQYLKWELRITYHTL